MAFFIAAHTHFPPAAVNRKFGHDYSRVLVAWKFRERKWVRVGEKNSYQSRSLLKSSLSRLFHLGNDENWAFVLSQFPFTLACILKFTLSRFSRIEKREKVFPGLGSDISKENAADSKTLNLPWVAREFFSLEIII
jgi:hypothetical protein